MWFNITTHISLSCENGDGGVRQKLFGCVLYVCHEHFPLIHEECGLVGCSVSHPHVDIFSPNHLYNHGFYLHINSCVLNQCKLISS